MVDKRRPLLLAPAGGEPPDTAAVCRHAAEDRGVAGTGGINGKLIADKLDRRGAERGAVRRESPARAAYLSWKAAGTARSGPPPPPRAGHNRQTGAELTLERLSGEKSPGCNVKMEI